jgi:signal transduction histidine kinase
VGSTWLRGRGGVMDLNADQPAVPPTRRVTVRIVLLLGLHLMITCGLLALYAANGGRFGAVDPLLGVAAAFALVGLLPMEVELGRTTCRFTLVEGVLVVALFTLGPIGVVATAAVGAGLAGLTRRQPRLEVAYQLVATAMAAAAASGIFNVVGGPSAHKVGAWLAALLATAVFAVCSHVSTSLLLAATGEGTFEHVLVVSSSLAALGAAVSGSAGLAVTALQGRGWVAPFLLAPLVAVVTLETRRAAAHRAERLRFERLYSASARTTGLQGFAAALAQAAGEARALVTGDVAVCCAPDRAGVWRGMVVDDSSTGPANPSMVNAVVGLVEAAAGREVNVIDLPAGVREALPPGRMVVAAGTTITSSPGQASGIALAVLRNHPSDEGASGRAKVLWAFVFHAALITTNALLFERVEDALRHQVDLNRQKDEFLAAVSHELRTPLASMLGSVETLRRLEGRMDAEARGKFFGIALRQGKRLQRLIEELLLTAAVEHRQESVVVEQVDLTMILDEVAEDLGAASEGRIVVESDPAASPLTTDPSKLRQILTNLVENAVKYAPAGRIELSAHSAPGRGAVITVTDHGPGIATDDRARVFERFVQLDGSSTRTHGGTGLGLYLCRRLAELLDGELELTETVGGGATFILTLPRFHSTAFVSPARPALFAGTQP